MTKPIVVSTTVFWANTQTVNDLSQKYQVNLGGLSEKAVEALQDNGIEVKNKGDDQGFFITVKSANLLQSMTPMVFQSLPASATAQQAVQLLASMTGRISVSLVARLHWLS